MMTRYIKKLNPAECQHSVKKIIKVGKVFETHCLFCEEKLEVV